MKHYFGQGPGANTNHLKCVIQFQNLKFIIRKLTNFLSDVLSSSEGTNTTVLLLNKFKHATKEHIDIGMSRQSFAPKKTVKLRILALFTRR